MNMPRILISAPRSGEGKTTVTCGILQALMNRGLKLSAFKSGPDYIDPMFHKKIIDADSHNMDLFFVDESMARGIFSKYAKDSDFSVIEGAMGYYDGLGGISHKASAYEVSKALRAPVIMTINARGASLSLGALIKGFKEFRKDSNIAGIILNKCSKMLYERFAGPLEEETGIPIIGYLTEKAEIAIESRHLGLVTAGEQKDLKEKIMVLAEEIEKSVDLDKLIAIGNSAPEIKGELPPIRPMYRPGPKIAVAMDEAFCFYYDENLDILKELGGELINISPLNDAEIPENIDALYIGGGYPELYADKLSKNKSMLKSIKNAADKGMPVFAECGGFLYLNASLEGTDSTEYPMAGVFSKRAYKTEKLQRFGYISLISNEDNILVKKGESINAHEFHYWDTEENGRSFIAEKPFSNRQYECIIAEKNIFAGFPHLYFYGNIEFAKGFIKSAYEFHEKRIKNE